MFLICLVAGLVLFAFIKSYSFFKQLLRIRHLSKQFVIPKTIPILGNATILLGLKPEQVLYVLEDLFEKYGKTLGFWFSSFTFGIFMMDIKNTECILSSNTLLIKSSEYNVLRNWLREGLLISKPPKWHQRRKILTAAFHFNILEQYIEIFDCNARIFVNNLEKIRKSASALVNIDHWINLVTLDVICETAMGVSVNAQSNVDSEYVRAVKTISTALHIRMIDILHRWDLIYRFTKLAQEEKKALAILHGFSENVIIQRREELLKAQKISTHKQDDDVGEKRKMAFLDILLQSEIDGKPLTNLDIREEVDTFMFEGHDTTSSALSFCFYNLAMHPECQQKCFEEIIQVFGKDKSKPATYENLNKLNYMELCIKETLRLFPSVPVLGRRTIEECEINGKIIPAGINVGVSPYFLGRQEELFPDAKSFKPERFTLDYTTDKTSPYAFIPFSAGPRNCIGQKFAMLEMKTLLATALRHYEFEYAGDKNKELLLVAELVLRPKDPLMCKIKPRVY